MERGKKQQLSPRKLDSNKSVDFTLISLHLICRASTKPLKTYLANIEARTYGY